MKKVKIGLLILAIALFCLNYQICEYFYADDIKKWWDLKINIYSVVFGLILVSYSIGKTGWMRFILYIGSGFAVSSMIDKIFLNVNEFTEADLLMILTILIFASINLIKDRLNGRYD